MNTTYKGKQYHKEDYAEVQGEGNAICFTRGHSVSVGGVVVPIPPQEEDRICVTGQHSACVLGKDGVQVALDVSLLQNGMVLCDASVISELSEEWQDTLFISTNPIQPINGIISQFSTKEGNHSSIVPNFHPYDDVKLLERIPQYGIANGASVMAITDSSRWFLTDVKNCSTFSCIKEAFEDGKYYPSNSSGRMQLDPDLKLWLRDYVVSTSIQRMLDRCLIPQSFDDLVNTALEPQKTCIRKLMSIPDEVPEDLSRTVRIVSIANDGGGTDDGAATFNPTDANGTNFNGGQKLRFGAVSTAFFSVFVIFILSLMQEPV
jgi:hypothetical protein